MCGSTLPRAWTSRCAISSLTRSTLSKIVGTITMVRASAGTDTQLEPRQPPRRDQVTDDPLHDLDRQLARRHGRQQRDPGEHRASPAVLVGHRQGHRDQRGGAQRNRAEIAGCRVAEEEAPDAPQQPRAPADALLERLTAAADQVVADVRAALGRGLLGHLSRAFDALQREHAAGRHLSVRRSPRPPGGSDRGSGSPSGHRRRPDRAAAPARRG